jgi:hypothetical protein
VRPRHEVGDLSRLGRVADGYDHAAGLPVGHGRPGERHVGSFRQRGVPGQLARGLGDGHRFARQRGLFDLEVADVEQPQIRRDGVAGLHADNVADHQRFAPHAPGPSAADDSRLGDDQRVERADRVLRASLLHEADKSVHHHHAGDHHRVDVIAERDRDDRGRDQHDDQRFNELRQQEPERRGAATAGQRVATVACEPPRRLVVVETLVARRQRLEDRTREAGMPGRRRGRRRRRTRSGRVPIRGGPAVHATASDGTTRTGTAAWAAR